MVLPEAEEARLLAVLKDAVARHGILRVKGFAAIPGKPMRLLVQGVGQRFDRHFERAWQAGEPRASRLVLIGQKLDRSAIKAELQAALA
ncbi:cobalamin biosynthesis protein CobW [compost metagenome]